MNLRELSDRFDTMVRAVETRIRATGVDPGDVLVVSRGQFKLTAFTAPGANPRLFYSEYVRESLTTPTPVDDLADAFVRKWKDQTTAGGKSLDGD